MSSIIGALKVTMGLDSAQFSKGLKDAQSGMARAGKQMQRVGLAASAVGAGVALAVRGQLNAADNLGKTAQKIGIPVEALSQLQHAAAMSGASMSDLEAGIGRLSRNMVDSEKKFEAVGIAVRDAGGNMRPTQDVLFDLSNVLAAMPDGAEKTALAMELMGRGGASLIPMLNGGADAMRAMMQEADALGLTISTDTAKAAEQFNDNLSRLGGQIKGLVTIMTAQLAPILVKISDFAVDVAKVFQSLSPEMQKFIGIMGGLSVVVGPLLIALGLMVTALAGISAPVLLAVVAVAALTAGLVAFWPEIVKAKDAVVTFLSDGIDKISGAMDGAATAMREGMDRGVEWVKQSFDELIAYFTGLPARFKEFGTNIIQGLTDGITERWDALKGRVTGVGDSIKDGFKDLFKIRSPSQVFHEYGAFLMQGLANGIVETAQYPVAAIKNIGTEIADGMSHAATTLESTFESAFTSFVTGAMSAREAASQLLSSLAKMAANSAFQSLLGGSSFGGLGAIFGGRSFAGGGYTGNGPRSGGLDGQGGFMAMMHPRETVIDHTRGQVGGAPAVNVSFNIDARGSVEGEAHRLGAYMRQAAPDIERRVISAIQNKRSRGHAV